ncbi:Crp/Fnr family transcriptional regulator [Amycolatopsis jiangsuensis]|uniref:CRP-like cAMP-binding protein n=1 Tax=Amycolatopsis jiangsuensis TaxID=1181879 RepID=A0A840IQF5_9PSEU|nr:Crp/Fnr family transcriptional regulator [Amycolatopsis jiangsuensis]MBB4684616.1 CRP-like cAMP-binding protein [Amycolatopsis jiangsuensis]
METTGFWPALGPAERGKVAELAVRRSYRRGEVVCREGDRSVAVVLLVSGHVRITNATSDGREVVIAVRGAGDVVAELGALDGRPRSATVEALDELEALVVPAPRFAALCRRDPAISWVLLLVLAARLRDAGRQRTDLGGGTIARRVAAQLMQLAVEHGVQRGSDLVVAIPGTQAELAMTAAISRESWARATRELRRRGVISTARRQVVVHRLGELRRLAR